jgi:hypothetical protein
MELLFLLQVVVEEGNRVLPQRVCLVFLVQAVVVLLELHL